MERKVRRQGFFYGVDSVYGLFVCLQRESQ